MRFSLMYFALRSRLVTLLAAVVATAALSGCGVLMHGAGDGGSECSDVARHFSSSEDSSLASLYVPSTPPAKLPEPKLVMNKEVSRELTTYQKGSRRSLDQALQNRARYLPQLQQIFQDEGVPESMLNLAMIESGFNPSARSESGAVGIWQFMKTTATLYGLRVGQGIDERKDPVRSTLAAARHLRDLFSMYGDWHLVLAAYNAGPGAVDRAMYRSGTTDFWTIARKGMFSKQTTDFVPRFIATAMTVKEYDDQMLAKADAATTSDIG